MQQRELRRYAAYFRGWCQPFGEHESIHREADGVYWLLADSQVGLVLPKHMVKALYREVLLRRRPPVLVFKKRRIGIGELELVLPKKVGKKARKSIGRLFDDCDEVHVFLTSHLLYGGSRIITFSSRKPIPIIYKEIGRMHVRLG